MQEKRLILSKKMKICIKLNMKNTNFLKNNLIAHRGIHNKYIENTIPAFQEAINLNHPIELDVRLTKDKEIIVFHDSNLKRIFQINREIDDLTIQEIKKYKYIPTLKEVLTIINNKVPIIIDIKSNKEIIKELINLLDNYDGNFTVQSYNPFILLWFKRNRPNYISGFLIYKYIYLKSLLFILKPDYIITNLSNLKKFNKYRNKFILIGYTLKTKKEYHMYINQADNFICDIQGKIKNKETVPLRTVSQKE